MVSSVFKALFASFLVATAVSARTPSNFRRSTAKHHDVASDVAKRATLVTTSPEFVIYSDKWVNEGSPPASSVLAGWTVFAISFWLTGGPADMAQGWQELTAAQRTAVKTDYASAGIKLIVAAFGSTDTPTSSGADPTDTANALASFVTTYDLDGADIDYEDFAAMNGGTGEAWLVTFTTALRAALPEPYVITHAPVAPWFTDDTTLYPGGGYLHVNAEVGSLISWYNVQFYNQGTTEYTDCTTLLTKSVAFPHASLFEIIANGVPANSIVIGKPAIPSDSTNGYMAPADLAVCIAQAKAQGWDAGLMVWEYPDEPTDFITTAWEGSTVSPTSTGTTTATGTTTSTAPTSTASSGCALAVDTSGGTCGSATQFRCVNTSCCSSGGYCGVGDAWCGTGCQVGYGLCTGDPAPTCSS